MTREPNHEPVSHSMGHYLMAVRDQLNEYGYARVTDIASRMDMSRGGVSAALVSLRDKGYLTEDKNHFFQLTPKGEQLAQRIYSNHLLLETFFRKILQISEETALLDACRIEHLLSPETTQKMLCFARYLLDNEGELQQLIQRMEDYRSSCPHVDHCELCIDQQQCPFFKNTLSPTEP